LFPSFSCDWERERLEASIKLLEINRFHRDYLAQAQEEEVGWQTAQVDPEYWPI
jgi:hypothetical protein